MAEDTRKNILEVDVVQSIDKTDTVLVNDSGSLKQVSVESLVSSGIPDQYVTESELTGKGYATTTTMNFGLNEKLDKNQGHSNSGRYLYVGADGNVTCADGTVLKGDIREEVEDYMSKNPVTVKTTDVVEKDNTLPVTSAGVYTVCGNIEALLQAL